MLLIIKQINVTITKQTKTNIKKTQSYPDETQFYTWMVVVHVVELHLPVDTHVFSFPDEGGYN